MNESITQNISDWDRIAQLDDADIDTSDIPPLDEQFFQAIDWWTSPHLSVDKETGSVSTNNNGV